ncbi:MAG: hypothetical protein K6E35_00205 [Bacteroidales bacterium]|nr:hypothetical protein [Bacteroidales bacterium]
MEIIFTDAEDFLLGITLLGICLAEFPRCRMLTFTLMSNHLHLILAGPHPDIIAFFERFKKRLGNYLSRKGRHCRLERFQAQTFQIPELQALRNELVYVNRNGYLVSPNCTPFSYRWGAGAFFFNPLAWMLPRRPFSALTIREQRAFCHSRTRSLPAHYQVLEHFQANEDAVPAPMLFPPSFCAIREAEGYFRDAHQYFRSLSRDQEAYSEIAKRLGDKVFLTDDELYGAITSLGMREFGIAQPSLLSSQQKIEMARKMHFDYNASTKQIQRILKLPAAVLNTMFPRPSSIST